MLQCQRTRRCPLWTVLLPRLHALAFTMPQVFLSSQQKSVWNLKKSAPCSQVTGRLQQGATRPLRSCAFENHDGQRLLRGVGQRQRHIHHGELSSHFCGNTVEGKRRFAAREVRYFEILPAHAAAPAGADRFHASFLRGKTGGVTLKLVRLAFDIRDLVRGEDPVDETRAMAANRFTNPGNFGEIGTDSNDHNSAPVDVIVSLPCFTPLVLINASAIFFTADALPRTTSTSRQLS